LNTKKDEERSQMQHSELQRNYKFYLSLYHVQYEMKGIKQVGDILKDMKES